MRQIFTFTTLIFFLVGCGGGGSSSSTSSSSSYKYTEDETMVVSQSYIVYPGNKIIQTSPDTLIRIVHTDGEEQSTVTLVEGNATIIRNP